MAWGGVNREEIDSPEVQARNVAGSLDCVEAAGRLGCRVFMDAGSRVEYGAVDGIMEEEAPCRPINEYGKAKWEFYQKAAPLCSRLGLHYYHLRFFSVYGCGDHPWSIISTLVRDLRQDKKDVYKRQISGDGKRGAGWRLRYSTPVRNLRKHSRNGIMI